MSLRREIGWKVATAVVVANMIGTGIFTSTGSLAGELGSPLLVLVCWLLGGLAAIAGAACYAELATVFPESGGEYVYLREIFGPLPAYLSGWISFVVGFSAPTAAAALALAAYLAPFLPVLSPEAGEPLWRLGPIALRLGGGQILALAVILSLAAVHALGLRPGARTQGTLTTFKLLLLVVFLLAGFAFGGGSLGNLAHPVARTSDATLPAAFAVSLVLVMFAYSGFNAASYLGGEIRDPRRNLPRSTLTGTAVVTALYLALNVLFLYARPLAAYRGRPNVGEIAAGALFGPRIAGFFGLMMAGALLSTVSAMIMAGPRVTWAMARNGAFPRWAGQVDSQTHVPVRAIVIQAAMAALLVVTGTLWSLMIFVGFGLSLFAALTVAGVIVLRRRYPGAAGYRVPLYPFTPLFFCVVSGWMMIYSFRERPYESWAVVGVLLVASGVYALAHRGSRGSGRA